MPELPDVSVYVEALERRLIGQPLVKFRLASPFLLRTFDPPPAALEGKNVRSVRRMGKRIVLGFDDELFLIIHLMIAGRFRWVSLVAPASPPADPAASSPPARAGGETPPGSAGEDAGVTTRSPAPKIPGKLGLAALDFPNGTLILTEAGSKRRASMHIVRGEEAVRAHDPGGLEVLDCTLAQFREALTRERHTLKRTLTDPHVFSGIGNAYSDEILHRARLSPVQLTTNLDDEEIERLWRATRETLLDWTERLRAQTGDRFPEKVTAFRPEMAVHGRYDQPCPDCGSPVQRIVYADNETNYCARCQTGGKLLADRALSRLLHSDWPKSIDEL